jgi:hypothetical protein
MNRLRFYLEAIWYDITSLSSRIKNRWRKISECHKSFIIPSLDFIIQLLKVIPSLDWVRYFYRLELRYQSSLSHVRPFIQFTRAVEAYVLFWLVIEVVFITSLLPNCTIYICPTALIIICCIRLIEIFRVWLDVLIVGMGDIASAPRLLILVLINYCEIIIIFAIITFLYQNHFPPPFESIQNSLVYSFDIMLPTMSISPFHQRLTCCASAIFYSEIVFGLLFIVVIIQRVLSYFRSR